MKTLSNHALLRAFPPTRTTFFDRFQSTEGWLTNGYFIIKEQLEPKSSRAYRYQKSDVKAQSVVDKTSKNLGEYEVAEIQNQLKISFDKTFLIKLESESGKFVWCNPRYISYVLQGLSVFQDLKIMIGKDYTDPIVFTDQDNQILAMVMGFRNEEE